MSVLQAIAIGETSKVREDGQIEVALKVAVMSRRDALELAALTGKQVNVMRLGGEVVDIGAVRSVSMTKRTKASQPDEAVDATAKIIGGRAFQKIVGVPVQLVIAQPDLPLRAAIERLRPKGPGIDSVEITGPDGEGVRLEKGKTTVESVSKKPRGKDAGA